MRGGEKMKIGKFLVIALVLLLVTTAPAFASSDELPSPGLTPDSPFYFLEVLWEKILISLTFNPEKKADLIADIASEKVAEAMEMVEESSTEAAEVSLKLYENYLQEVLKIINNSELLVEQVELKEKLQLVTQKHLEILETLSSTAPQSLKEALEETKELVEESFETILEVSEDEEESEESDEVEELEASHEQDDEEEAVEVSSEEGKENDEVDKKDDHPAIYVDDDEDYDKDLVEDEEENEVEDVKSEDEQSLDAEEDEDD
jgi:hypothetical protein